MLHHNINVLAGQQQILGPHGAASAADGIILGTDRRCLLFRNLKQSARAMVSNATEYFSFSLMIAINIE